MSTPKHHAFYSFLLPYMIVLLTALICDVAVCKTYWGDVLALKQIKAGIAPDSLSPGSCISSWDFSYDPCDSLFSEKFTCGFTCDVVSHHGGVNTSRITELALDQVGYSAQLGSISWHNLQFLRTLDLSSNNFSGSIPDSFSSNLTRLTKLILSGNSLSGQLPDSLSQLGALEEIYLDNNRFVGPIPEGFNGLVKLKRLELQGNRLSGEFPDLSPLGELIFVDCSENLISGEFPASFPATMVGISMRNNNLSGKLDENRVSKLSYLQVLDLSSNRLAGSVPASLFAHPSLQQVSLAYNNFTSIEVPSGVGSESGLIALDLSYNDLGGLLPGFLGLMPRLSSLSLQNNRFMGLIPTQYALRAAWPEPGVAPFERLLLGGNYLFGPIPDPLKRLEPDSARVDLVGNCLFVCPIRLFFCQGGDQKSLAECRNAIGPIIP